MCSKVVERDRLLIKMVTNQYAMKLSQCYLIFIISLLDVHSSCRNGTFSQHHFRASIIHEETPFFMGQLCLKFRVNQICYLKLV